MTQIQVRLTIRKKSGEIADDLSKTALTDVMRNLDEHLAKFRVLDETSVPDDLHLTIAEAKLV